MKRENEEFTLEVIYVGEILSFLRGESEVK